MFTFPLQTVRKIFLKDLLKHFRRQRFNKKPIDFGNAFGFLLIVRVERCGEHDDDDASLLPSNFEILNVYASAFTRLQIDRPHRAEHRYVTGSVFAGGMCTLCGGVGAIRAAASRDCSQNTQTEQVSAPEDIESMQERQNKQNESLSPVVVCA